MSPSGRVLGTYVHGFFDNDDFRHAFLAAARRAVDLPPAETWANVAAEREARIDRLADHLRKSLDMNLIRSWIVARRHGGLNQDKQTGSLVNQESKKHVIER